MKKLIFFIALILILPTLVSANMFKPIRVLFKMDAPRPVVIVKTEPIAQEIRDNCMCVQQEPLLAGSLTATRYGGTGTDTSGWSSLVRVTAGVWATTSLTDGDVPDTITVTGISTLTMNTSTITTLNVGTTTSFGSTTFAMLPFASTTNATPTLDNQFIVKSYVDAGDYPIFLRGMALYDSGISAQFASTTYVPLNMSMTTSSQCSNSNPWAYDLWTRTYMPYAGTISNLWIYATPSENDGMTCTTTKNLIGTTLAATLGSGYQMASNTTDSFTVVAGDFIMLKCKRTSANATNENYWFSVKITQ